MFQLETTPGRTCIVNGKEFLFFSGYSYLGMNYVKEFTELIKEGIDKYGALFPSSRISNTRLKLYEEFENALSEITGMEDTVSFSSGYLAGKTIAEILSSYTDSYRDIFIAPDAHPAINFEQKIKTKSLIFDDWKKEIVDHINLSSGNEFVIAFDSVNIFKTQIQDLSFLKNIETNKKIICLIDDSHGIGIIGEDGAGIASQLIKKNNIEYIICYSLSKSFNIQGGAVSSSKAIAEKLRAHPNYSGSTSISPSLIHAFLKSKELYTIQRKKLFKNISVVKKLNSLSFLKSDFDLPIFICQEKNAEEIFHTKEIIISSFSYPFSDSEKINRAVINALHTNDDIKKLCGK